MKLRVLTILIGGLTLAAGAHPLRAGQDGAGQSVPQAPGLASITGYTMTVERTPFPYAQVRLRDLDSGMVVGETSSNQEGEFSFVLDGGGTFMPEVVDVETGEVLGVGDMLAVAPGETAGTDVLLPSALVPFGALFGTSAAELVDEAANEGIASVTQGESLSGEQ